MPSLRRTLSSPPARRGPYSYPTSLSSGNQTRAGPHQPRRSSGSDVGNRRVLADIDWWVVQDGQLDVYDASTGGRPAAEATENDADLESVTESVTPTAPTPGEGVDAVLPAWQAASNIGVPASEVSGPTVPYFGDMAMEGMIGVGSPQSLSPLSHFADLTLAPSTPPRRRLTHSAEFSDDSFSSVGSTPESTSFALLATPPQPSIGLMDFDAFFSSNTAFISPARRPTASPGVARSASYSFIEDEVSGAQHRRESIVEDPFADVVTCAPMPVPPPFFSETQLDVDDLFF
ncbi:uncharacterized protein B0H18DRAFT_1116844 [Fomitopsis serialis]|uniref:uncharacterized protein n=1 Tax=Fomitopsis serialis TaxID=139415 RepID=UPI0020086AD6|nr:uncharacterized protein B0H18DRAFT_1116844 [Neoantrodia serialis]KAH9930732.1 hypothetical protein B0H18DRAFT_1116844 [Neoantrodia serialis]